jgi:hypothetical protein
MFATIITIKSPNDTVSNHTACTTDFSDMGAWFENENLPRQSINYSIYQIGSVDNLDSL